MPDFEGVIEPDTSGQYFGFETIDGSVLQMKQISGPTIALTPGAGGGGAKVNVIAAGGATPVFDLSKGNVQDVTLTANATPTIINPSAGGDTFRLWARQDATGSRLVTWPASVKWAGGTAPTLTTTASHYDVLQFESPDGGTTWVGRVFAADPH